MPLQCKGGVKHDGEVLGPVQGKANVGESGVLQPIENIGLLACSSRHGGGQFLISLRGDGRDQIFFITEVTIWRIVRDAGAARDFTKSEGGWSDLPDEPDGGLKESLLQVAVMVWLKHSMRSFSP